MTVNREVPFGKIVLRLKKTQKNITELMLPYAFSKNQNLSYYTPYSGE